MTKERVKGIYRKINDCMVSKDITMLRKMVLPDTFLVHMTGYVQPVEEWIEQIVTEEMRYYSWKEESIHILEMTENRARLVGRSLVEARIWGMGPSVWHLQIEMTLEKRCGVWKVSKQVASAY